MIRRLLLPLALPLSILAGCGDGAQEAANNGAAPQVLLSEDEVIVQDRPGESMTAIDAATGDTRGMPADYAGPTAYDLRDRSEGRPADGERGDTPPPPPAVTSENAVADLPTVAE